MSVRQQVVVAALPSVDDLHRWAGRRLIEEPLIFAVPGTVEELGEGGRC